MTRGLPLSILLHALTLGLVLVFGNSVDQRKFEVPRTIGVRLVELPRQAKPEEKKPENSPVVQPPKPQPEKVEILPPKELPEAKPEEKKDPPPEKPIEKKPLEVLQDPETEPVDSDPVETVTSQLPTGASVDGTDTNFPFAWYLSVMEGQVARNWNPRQMGFRNDSGIACVVHFTIQRNGAVSQITLTRSSGIGVYDREALRAVQSTRLPQLPGEFGANTLGVTMTFNLESGVR